MAVELKGNYIFTQPGQKAFLASSNFVNYLELGRLGGNGFFLQARIGRDQFWVSARLFDEEGKFVCVLRDNHLVDKQPGCELRTVPSGGYRIYDKKGRVVFELGLINPTTCLLQGRFYSEKGELVAHGDAQDFKILRGPAILGKAGASIGISVSG